MEPKNSKRTTAFDGAPYIPGAYCSGDDVSVFVPGKSDPSEAEVTFLLSEDEVTNYMNIMSITPKDKNPVLYWHQVAMDAIKAQESAQKQAKQAREDLRRTERELQNLTSGLVARTADKRALIPLDMSRLIDMAKFGYIDLNVCINISKGKDVSDHD